MNEPLSENSEATQKLRIAVVGGGPGGYAAAFLAADLGMQVTLIDPELNPGACVSIAAAFLRKRCCTSPS